MVPPNGRLPLSRERVLRERRRLHAERIRRVPAPRPLRRAVHRIVVVSEGVDEPKLERLAALDLDALGLDLDRFRVRIRVIPESSAP